MPVFRAPGRVNLIGEHTDYNSGFVLPVAIQFATRVTIQSREDRRLTATSSAFADTITFDLDDPAPALRHDWTDYVRGVATQIEHLNGANLTIESDVPIGAGLSSSAALEVATALALLANSAITLDPLQLALLCQRAENEFVGARCGIMDQFTSVFAREGTALLLDCRSLEANFYPVPGSVRLVVCNTMVRHDLATNEYNLRRQQTEIGTSLRDLSLTALAQANLDPLIYRRCRHVITENRRVLDAAAALERSDLKTFGTRMIESHHSLRDDYEVSCAELDTMVALALELPGVYGARMTGGGFGGCTINLVDAEHAPHFAKQIASAYFEKTGIQPDVYICEPSSGAKEIQ